jgi:hypothetical protein
MSRNRTSKVRVRGGRSGIAEHEYPPVNQSEYLIHPPKIAGTAMAVSLGIRRTHDSASYIKEVVGPRWKDVRIFSAIRNPWDRALSWFMYNSKYREHYAKTKTDFNRWIDEGMGPAYTGTRDARLLYQEDFIEIDGECVLDFWLRFETLHDDWLGLILWLGRKFVPLTNNDHSSIEDKPDYREWFTNDSIKKTEPRFEYFAEKYGYAYGDEPGHVKRARATGRVRAGVPRDRSRV